MSDINCKGCTEGGYHSGKCTYYPKEKAMSKFQEEWQKHVNRPGDLSFKEVAECLWNESRRIALEEAAKAVEEWANGWPVTAKSLGDTIRKLKEDL